MKKVIAVLSIILIAGCAAKKTTTTSAPVAPVVPAEHAQGKMLYDQHCGNCHALPTVTSHSAEEWKGIVPNMVKKVNKKENNVLDATAQDQILQYVLAMQNK